MLDCMKEEYEEKEQSSEGEEKILSHGAWSRDRQVAAGGHQKPKPSQKVQLALQPLLVDLVAFFSFSSWIRGNQKMFSLTGNLLGLRAPVGDTPDIPA